MMDDLVGLLRIEIAGLFCGLTKEASQARDYCVAKNATLRAARSGSLDLARDRLFGDEKAVASG